MFDHVTIYVPDRDASASFFDTVLIQLGIETSYRTNSFAEWDDFSLTHSDDDHPLTTGLHVGFAAPTREHVDAFWQAGVDAGYLDDGPPGPREYLPDYYGSFLRSPDGNSIEAVNYSDVPRRNGIIDHLWIRVADLAASTGFYRVVADSLGLSVEEQPGRTTVRGPDGGSFALLEGELTEHVHMAFATEDNAVVDRFHAQLTAAGYRDYGAPGERPRHHPGYYAAYVLDPDGHNIEAVNHNRT
jgi:catechol 2,3-dioxygenase-like lactoylglutathione lyase family enzyme